MLKKVACCLSLFGALLLGAQTAAAQNHGGECHHMKMPLLTVPDVDGDGDVDANDVQAVTHAKNGAYHLIYDLNVDGTVDGTDVSIVAQAIGSPVPLVDTQVATTTLATMHLSNHSEAVSYGYNPGTQWFDGHGYHYINTSLLGNDFSFTTPAGVNMDLDGNQTAVFWFIDSDLYSKPEGYAGMEDMWHHHAEVCAYNLGGKNAAGDIDVSKPFFVEDSSYVLASLTGTYAPYDAAATCTTLGYILRAYGYIPTVSNPTEIEDIGRNKFYMLHLWTEKANECGRFAGEDPEVVAP